ncbi:ATP-dependent RNA helicase DDX24 isoform X1 [Danio aesculapii]|uniref:ATP-dependent RNA helicase DDX24 isoform X1 n=1 Tax=Danio aesculapii TaxID=1142201 RepID=UPI0024C079D9|nr:ATP-dependent RNA helicase DDX24 isoform X1 [Danio aesculapii]XP_056332665.1 ATP-dependent RNA helicase DDX24 isoform X1 [Danio aesculapii]
MKVKKAKVKTPRPRLISSRRGVLVRGQWKAVNVDPSLFSDEGLDGLVCFEELTDYSLVEPEKALTEHVQTERRSQKKRKTNEERRSEDEDVADLEDGVADDGGKPEKKKKKKNKQEEEETLEEEQISAEESPELTTETPQTSKKKKRKKKKKKKPEEEKKQHEEESSAAAGGEAESALPQKSRHWSRASLEASGPSDVSSWRDLLVPEPVLRALAVLGFSAPTAIQALVLPPAIRDRLDILGAAETGSGKTLCFGIPMIHMILQWREQTEEHSTPEHTHTPVQSLYLQEEGGDDDDDDDDDDDGVKDEDDGVNDDDDGAEGCSAPLDDPNGQNDPDPARGVCRPLLGLVLTPTRELAVQVKHHIDAVAQFTGIKTAIVVGGMAPQKQHRVLMRRPEIIIATPGRLWEMIREKHPHLQDLRQLRCLVLDEADRMVEKGHFAELESLLELLNTSQFSSRRQTFVFSATLTLVHSLPSRLQQKKKKQRQGEQRSKLQLLMEKVGVRDKPKIIDLTRKQATVETLTETRISCTKEDKDLFLYYFLLQFPGRSMVFANSIACIKRLYALLHLLDCTPLMLHANMHQKQRLKNLERFAENTRCVLLTTDVAARGLDIPDVQHVIHYQVPRTSETYVHRSGRTARATREGLSLLLISPDDLLNYRRICRTLDKSEELPVFPVESKCMAAVKERVDLAHRIEKMEYFHSRETQHNSWVRQAAEAMDIDVDDELLMGSSKGEDEEREQQREKQMLRKQLKILISQPVFRSQMKTRYPTQMGKLLLPTLPQDTALASLKQDTQSSTRRR